ncbi:isochorismatase family protein [Streptomyces sp. NBC_01601]|uniref:isochorismatase family protein n=1 Tax=Streptomyces sp. NBC_01601 TaxID=2975892 RepID=UPI002E2855C6|nr:isochorismatase family protein [Streptomyces sp. NBC_01601]
MRAEGGTDCCVPGTALAAVDAGTEVLVVADACAGVDDEAHARALHGPGPVAAPLRVTTVDALLAEAGH